MTFLVPVAIGGGALLLAYLGKRKQAQTLDNGKSISTPSINIPEVSNGGVGDPTSPASRMSGKRSDSAVVEAPVTRGKPPNQAPVAVTPVPTAKAPMLGVNAVTNAALMARVGR